MQIIFGIIGTIFCAWYLYQYQIFYTKFLSAEYLDDKKNYMITYQLYLLITLFLTPSFFLLITGLGLLSFKNWARVLHILIVTFFLFVFVLFVCWMGFISSAFPVIFRIVFVCLVSLASYLIIIKNYNFFEQPKVKELFSDKAL